jgi:hypothetical protein
MTKPDPAEMVRALAGSGARFAGVWDRPPVQTAGRSPTPPANRPSAPTEANPPATAEPAPVLESELKPAPTRSHDETESTDRVIDGGPNRWLAQHWDGKRWHIRAITRTKADALAQLKPREPA